MTDLPYTCHNHIYIYICVCCIPTLPVRVYNMLTNNICIRQRALVYQVYMEYIIYVYILLYSTTTEWMKRDELAVYIYIIYLYIRIGSRLSRFHWRDSDRLLRYERYKLSLYASNGNGEKSPLSSRVQYIYTYIYILYKRTYITTIYYYTTI